LAQKAGEKIRVFWKMKILSPVTGSQSAVNSQRQKPADLITNFNCRDSVPGGLYVSDDFTGVQ
jgi:hypothetical protein